MTFNYFPADKAGWILPFSIKREKILSAAKAHYKVKKHCGSLSVHLLMSCNMAACFQINVFLALFYLCCVTVIATKTPFIPGPACGIFKPIKSVDKVQKTARLKDLECTFVEDEVSKQTHTVGTMCILMGTKLDKTSLFIHCNVQHALFVKMPENCRTPSGP